MTIVQWTIIFAMFTTFQANGDLDLPGIELPPVHETGLASWYGDGAWHGTMTANGETFDPTQFTCAHRTLPFDTLVLIENRANRRRVWCRINDRGPFGITTPDGDWDFIVSSSPQENWRGIIDMSHATAEALGTLEVGLQTVHLRYWTRPSTRAFNLAVLNP